MGITDSIAKWTSEVVGKQCWGVSAGGCVGSAFGLYIGGRVPRNVPIQNPMLPLELRNNDGEFELFVQGAMWILGVSSGTHSKVITDSDDDCSAEGPVVKGLELLINNTIRSASFDLATNDLDVFFVRDDMRLKVFGKLPAGHDGYCLFLPHEVIQVTGQEAALSARFTTG